MCKELHTHYPCCPHTRSQQWSYCAINSNTPTPAAGKACRRYRRKTKRGKLVDENTTECQSCAMDRKIREDFGDCVSRVEVRKTKRFWRGGDVKQGIAVLESRVLVDEGDAVASVLGDVDAWPASEMRSVVLPDPLMSEGEREHKRSRHDSASLLRQGGLGRFDIDGHGRALLRWIKGIA